MFYHVLPTLNGYGSIPINTIFSGLFTSINPSYFDVNYRGTIGFDPSPNQFESSQVEDVEGLDDFVLTGQELWWADVCAAVGWH